MVATVHEPSLDLLEIARDELIDAPLAVVFETLLEQLGPQMGTMPDAPMPMKLEAWPGGRWFRDLGNGAGHLWGHIQVIKPPTLLEICGPLCMSYPAMNHVQYRLTAEGESTRLAFLHRAIGQLLPGHRDGMPQGWAHGLARLREAAERKHGAK